MNTKVIFSALGIAAVGAASWYAYNHYNSQPEEVTRKPRGRPRKK